MDELQIAGQMMEQLQRDPMVAEYFETNIQWLKDRFELWNSQYMRIGVVGVTSSGKSTLLNAFLGDNILPVAVRPSSGTLTTCVKSSELKAKFYFSDGTPPRTAHGSNLTEEIRQYADEEENPKNEKKIRFIAIESPGYLLDADIQIVDSPGLDADGYEFHETLTMEELLPTVDLCLYVVTMKANSDRTTYQVIESIRHHQKPLVIVQNMLDSVERKIGSGGAVLKTKEEVAVDHKERVRRIVSKVDPSLQKLVDVVQVSAKQALQGRIQSSETLWRESQLEQLITIIGQNVDRVRPQIKRNRLLQLYRHFTEMVAEETQHSQPDMQDSESFMIPSVLTPHLEQTNEIRAQFAHTQQKTQMLLSQIENTFIKTISSLESIGRDRVYEAKTKMDDVQNQVQSLEKEIVQGLRVFHNGIVELLKALNLNPNDYIGNDIPNPRTSAGTFQVKKRVAHRTVRQKKSGFGGGVARIFGKLLGNDDWGYEEAEIEYEEFDLSAMKNSLMRHHEKTIAAMNDFLWQWEQRMDHLQAIVTQEVDRRIREASQKRNRSLAKKKVKELILTFREWIAAIGEYLGEYLGEREAASALDLEERPSGQTVPIPNRKQMEISKPMYSLVQLSHHLLSSQFHKILNFCQTKNREAGGAFATTLIWGWDEFSLLQFARRFLPLPIPDHLTALEQAGVCWFDDEQHRYVLVNELGLQSQSAVELNLMLEHRPYNAYVLVNTIQEGAAKKQYKNSVLHRMPHHHTAIVNLVSQSLEEFKTGQNLQEGIYSLWNVQKEVDQSTIGQLLLNDRNPIYSLLLCELSPRQDLTIADETEIMGQLRRIFPYLMNESSGELCTQILRAYSEIKK